MNDESEDREEPYVDEGRDDRRLQIMLTLIGAGATIIAAVIAGVFTVLPALRNEEPPPPPTVIVPTPAGFSVEIDGPETAPLGEDTYFTILSEGATRVEWAIAGFGGDAIDPFNQTDQIFVAPQDAARVDEWFTIVVTAYNSEGEEASARHRFRISAAEE